MRDPHDSREFRQFVKMNADGSVAGVVMVAAGAVDPVDAVYADVTHLYPTEMDALKVDPALVAAAAAAKADHADKIALVTAAVDAAAVAAAVAKAAHTVIVKALTDGVGK